MKTGNQYSSLLPRKFYESCPKAVLAALAVSYASQGGDHLGQIDAKLLKEWWVLFENGIVPQKPPMPQPADEIELEPTA